MPTRLDHSPTEWPTFPPAHDNQRTAEQRVWKELGAKILFRLAEEHRFELYYAFGLLCLGSWFVFNLWILRDYFFPCWFAPIYTAEGFPKQELEMKTQEILMRYKVSNAMNIPASIVIPEPSKRTSLGLGAPLQS